MEKMEEIIDKCYCLDCRIEDKIVDVEFTVLSHTTTVCLITLENGMEFVGKTFCSDIEIYDEDIMKIESFEDAKSQVVVALKYSDIQKEYKKYKKEAKKAEKLYNL